MSNNENEYTGFNRILRSKAVQILLDKKSEGSFDEFFTNWKWIFSFSSKYKGIIVFYTLLGILSSSLSLLSAYVSRVIINIVVSKELERLWFLIALMVGSMLVSLLFSSIMSRISTKISIYVNNDIQADIFDKIIDAKWSEITKYFGGDLVNRFNSDVGTISNNAVSWIPNLIINVYTFVITFIVLLKLDAVMAFIAILAGPILLVISRAILFRMSQYRKRVLELNSQMMNFEFETFFNMDMIKSFGVLGYYSRKIRKFQQQYKDCNLDYNKFQIKTNIIMTALSSLISMIAMLYCVFLLWTGRILFGDMTFFLQQRELLTGKFNSLVSTFPGMVNSSVSAQRIRELVNLAKESHDEESFEQVSKVASNGLTVSIKNASFYYRDDSNVYCESDFEARTGEIVAILGSSGGGKTTLMRMILGLIEPSDGYVSLVDCNGKKVEITAEIRNLFAYVPQGNTVLSGTIAENMRMVKEDATNEEIIEALKTAHAWEFVKDLPDGIDNKLYDSGRGISMGQGQRVSIARALLRNAPIILLDEATSALDIDTEREVLQSIIKKQPNKTYIIATHRPSVLNQANRVYKIIDNKIKELTREEIADIIRSYTLDED